MPKYCSQLSRACGKKVKMKGLTNTSWFRVSLGRREWGPPAPDGLSLRLTSLLKVRVKSDFACLHRDWS